MDNHSIREAIGRLREILVTSQVQREFQAMSDAKNSVMARFQPIFRLDQVGSLSEPDMRDFLQFKHNQHWTGLQRLGPKICSDIPRLRKAMSILLDETRSIEDRLNNIIPIKGNNLVKGLGRAVLTPILLIAYPDRYCVWNNTSDGALQILGIHPTFDKKDSFGAKYVKVNSVLCQLAEQLEMDHWTLDSLLWQVKPESEDSSVVEAISSRADAAASTSQTEPRGALLEKHLHDYLVDNWDAIPLGKDWMIYEEEGAPEAGSEYVCAVGRIDILARHRSEPRWLVIELKRNEGTDTVAGQLCRYMGWVKMHLANAGDTVEGMIIAHDADDSLWYAVSMVQGASVQLYEVKFHLKPVSAPAAKR